MLRRRPDTDSGFHPAACQACHASKCENRKLSKMPTLVIVVVLCAGCEHHERNAYATSCSVGDAEARMMPCHPPLAKKGALLIDILDPFLPTTSEKGQVDGSQFTRPVPERTFATPGKGKVPSVQFKCRS